MLDLADCTQSVFDCFIKVTSNILTVLIKCFNFDGLLEIQAEISEDGLDQRSFCQHCRVPAFITLSQYADPRLSGLGLGALSHNFILDIVGPARPPIS